MSWIDHQVPGQICHTSPICWSVLNQALNQAPNRRRLLPVPGDGSGSGFLSWGTPSLGSQVFRCAHGTHGMGMKLDKASSLQVLTILDPTWSNKQILINKKGCVSKPNGNSWSLKQPWNISMCVSIPQSPAPAILGWPKKGSARVTCLQVWSTAMPNLKDSPQPPLPRSRGEKTTAAMVHSKMRFSLSGKCCNGAKVDFSWPLSTLWSTCLYLILKQSSTRIYQQYIHANAPRWSRLPADKKLQRATLRQADWLHFKPQVNRQFQNTKTMLQIHVLGFHIHSVSRDLHPPDMGSKRSRSVIPSHEPLELELVKRILCFIL